jgi:hypothetical protein
MKKYCPKSGWFLSGKHIGTKLMLPLQNLIFIQSVRGGTYFAENLFIGNYMPGREAARGVICFELSEFH